MNKLTIKIKKKDTMGLKK